MTTRKNIVFFLIVWFAIALDLFFVVFLAGGWLAVLVGARQIEIWEHFELLSLPLGWASPVFLVRPDRSLLAVLGIIVTNSYFYAVVLFPVIKVVRFLLGSGKPTELGLSSTQMSELGDDD